ncbi:hypothetical protein KY285_004540 [Solanum tuberosum]|nr:hypothetical protein KY285_004540 [Solanum tuberosum]
MCRQLRRRSWYAVIVFQCRSTPNKDRKMQFVEQLVLVLCDLNLRENALLDLFKVYSSHFGEGVVPGFGPLVVTLIWYYRCTPTSILSSVPWEGVGACPTLAHGVLPLLYFVLGSLQATRVHLQRRSWFSYFFVTYPDVDCGKLTDLSAADVSTEKLVRVAAGTDSTSALAVIQQSSMKRGDFEFDVSEGARDNSATGGGDGVLRRNDKSTKAPCRHCGVHNGDCIFGLWL